MIRLGKFICWLRGRHKWGRAFDGGAYAKICRRCGAVAPVKRRVKKEKAA